MLTGTLARHIARRFAAQVALVLALALAAILLIDGVELVRRFGDRAAFSAPLGLKLAAMRAPAILDEALPFAFLFAAILSLRDLSRRQELAVARAAGMSVWGFLAPPLAVALVVGLAAALLGNPLAVRLKAGAERIEAELTGAAARLDTDVWFRQEGRDGPSIMHAGRIDPADLTAFAATAHVFAPDGGFRERAQAARATYADGFWVLRDVTVTSRDGPPRVEREYVLATSLTADELRRLAAAPETLDVWSLPGFAETARRSGLDADRFRLAFHSLLARPLLLAAMVTIAACVSLRPARPGGAIRLTLIGVAAGFLLYVLTRVLGDLGANGIVGPALAAWAPAVLALTFGASVLLRAEDG